MPEPSHAPPRLFVVGSFVEAHCWTVVRRPTHDESLLASGYTRECGGKGLAVAVGAHRLGAAVDLLVAAGHDAAGEALMDLLQREGLGTAHVRRLGEYSGHGCGLIDADGGSAITVFPGANALLTEAQVQAAAADLRRATVVYGQLESPLTTVRAALQIGWAAGALTVLNPSPWLAGAGLEADVGARAQWSAALAVTQVLVLNRVEATGWLEGLGARGMALHALPSDLLDVVWRAWPGGQWLVVTLGEQGCVAYGRNGAVHRAAGHRIEQPQPIGAGDAFSAGLCSALAAGGSMAGALRLANACGALAAGRGGILTALPRQAEVQGLLAAED